MKQTCNFALDSWQHKSGSFLPASLVDLNNGESLFGEKEQARLLAGEQLPCMLLVLLDKLTLFSLARWYGTWLGCALCKLAPTVLLLLTWPSL